MQEIKIASYNLDHSVLRSNLIGNIQMLAKLGTAIFCLQEIRTSTSEQFIGDEIVSTLGNNWDAKFLVSPNSKNDFGLGLIWNNNVVSALEVEELRFPILKKLKYWERFFEESYLSGEPRPVKRGALIGTFRIGMEEFRLSNVHLDWHGGFKQRRMQLEFLLKHLNAKPHVGEIICGDFNTVGFFGNRRQIQKIQMLLGDEFVNIFPNFEITTTHHQQLDHMFARNFKKNTAEIFNLPGSDHFPIMVSLSPALQSFVGVNYALSQSVERKQNKNYQ